MFRAAIGQSILSYSDDPSFFPPSVYSSYDIVDPSFAIDSTVGYRSGSFSIRTNRYMAEYLIGSLGSDVIISNNLGIQVWEGMIDKVSVSLGNLTIGAGPVSEISNKIKVRYTEYDWGVAPVVPEEVETQWMYSYDSIARWGTLEEYISLGREMSPGEMARIVPDIRQSKSRPKIYRDVATSGNRGNVYNVTFECIGYHFLLNKSYFAIYDGGTWNIGDAMRYILQQIPLLGTSGIMDIDQTVGKFTGEYGDPPETVSDVINEYITTLHSESGYGFVFGVYEGRQVTFRELVKPGHADYIISPHSGRLLDMYGNAITNIPRPGEWVSTQSVYIPQYNNDLVDSVFPISAIEFDGSGEIRINEIVRSYLASNTI